MHKKQRKQRQGFGFQTIQIISDQKDFTNNDSSTIIPVEDQHQSSLQQFQFKPNVAQPKLVCIKPRKTFTFQEQQQEQQTQNKNQKLDIDNYDNALSMQEVKQQENNEQNQKKQTVTTNNQQRSQQIKANMQIIKQNQQKIQTQDFQNEDYQEIQEENQDEQQNQIQQSIKRQKNNIKKLQTSFVAQSLEDLVFAEIPFGCTIMCAVNFNHQTFSTRREYKLYLVKQKKYLFTAVKNRLALTSQFIFLKDIKKKDNILGELKSNFTGVEYVINKYNFRDKKKISQQCWIGYDFNILGLAHQRKITILRNKNTKLQKIPFFSQIKNYYENGIVSNFEKFMNKQATKNKIGEYQLDFHGKVTSPSVKNFIIVDQKERQCLLFGKRTDNTFILQIGFPFSIFQGFAIAISNLDRKLCVR